MEKTVTSSATSVEQKMTEKALEAINAMESTTDCFTYADYVKLDHNSQLDIEIWQEEEHVELFEDENGNIRTKQAFVELGADVDELDEVFLSAIQTDEWKYWQGKWYNTSIYEWDSLRGYIKQEWVNQLLDLFAYNQYWLDADEDMDILLQIYEEFSDFNDEEAIIEYYLDNK